MPAAGDAGAPETMKKKHPPAADAASAPRKRPRRSGAPLSAPAPRYDLRVLTALRRIMRAVDLHSQKLRASHRVTGPQLVCLLALVEKGPMTATGLAREVHLSPSTLVGIMDRLEAAGLARRERDAEDRRIVRVAATEAGRALAARAPSPLQEKLAAALGGLEELEQATLALSLERIVDLMEAREVDASPILDSRPIGDSLDPGEAEPEA